MPTIEFGLPTGAGGMAAAAEAGHLRRALKQWSEHYNVELIVATARHDYRHWITVDFVRERDYTLFALSWTYKTFMRYQMAKNDS